MSKNPHKKKKSKVVKARSDNNGPDEKKTKLENVDQSELSFVETCKSLVKLNMNSFKNVGKTALDHVEDLNKQGIFCFIFLGEKQLSVSIPNRYRIRIFLLGVI